MFDDISVDKYELAKMIGLIDMMSDLLSDRGVEGFSYFINQEGESDIYSITTKKASEFSEELFQKYQNEL